MPRGASGCTCGPTSMCATSRCACHLDEKACGSACECNDEVCKNGRHAAAAPVRTPPNRDGRGRGGGGSSDRATSLDDLSERLSNLEVDPLSGSSRRALQKQDSDRSFATYEGQDPIFHKMTKIDEGWLGRNLEGTTPDKAPTRFGGSWIKAYRSCLADHNFNPKYGRVCTWAECDDEERDDLCGAHVVFEHPSVAMYIVPLCSTHNNTKDTNRHRMRRGYALFLRDGPN